MGSKQIPHAFTRCSPTTSSLNRESFPDDTQVLITHGPPHGILDKLPGSEGDCVGCEALLGRVQTLPSLKLHVYGHIHCSHGKVQRNGVQFVNASICDEAYKAVQAPIIVDL